jgi:hypothetical protein
MTHFSFSEKALLSIGKRTFKRNWYSEKWFETYRAGYGWLQTALVWQKLHRINKDVDFPVSQFNHFGYYQNVEFDPTSLNVFQGGGKYFNPGIDSKIKIGKNCYFAGNTGFLGVDHKLGDLDKADPGEDIIIGDRVWIGMNCSILKGVVLGDNTVVGASSVVTKSFESGNVIVVGNPARIVREI